MKKSLTLIMVLGLTLNLVAKSGADKVEWWTEAKFGLFIHGEYILFRPESIMEKT